VTIYTTLWNSGYGYGTGTSFATPITSAAVALVMSANPALAPSQIESALFSTATDLGAPGYDIQFGWGRVNVAAAVLAAKSLTALDTVPPSVAIASPTGGTASGIVPVSVSASDNVGVTKVQLYAGGVLVGTDSTAPYGFSWDTTAIANATYGLVAKAYDLAGNVASSSTVSVNVANSVQSVTATPAADTTAPVARITNPASGSKVKGKVAIQASGTDNVAVTTLSIYADGTLVATGNSASLSYNWNTTKIAAGSHALKAVAKDSAGNTGTVTISVTR
jgi:hypothetical protein